MSDKRRPVGIDLFSGAGGMSLGFEQAGFDVKVSVEIDPIHCAVHKFNFPECLTVCRNIADVTGQELKEWCNAKEIDVVFGGPPCQGFSMIGKRCLEDPRNSLVRHFIRIVKECNARYFVFENVKGLTVGKHRKVLEEIIAEFREAGYNVRLPWRVLNAVNFGVPQNRERIFLIGAKAGLRLPDYPTETTQNPELENGFLRLPPAPTVLQAIGDIPDAETYEDLMRSDCAKAKFGRPSKYAAILRGIANDPSDFSYRREFDNLLLTSSLRSEHTAESRSRFKAAKPGQTEPISRFFKLSNEGVSNTLRAGTASDRGAFTSPRPIHPVFARCITVREAARLHSYPDWFRFHETKWHGARQVGNSVPPLLARSVAATIRIALNIEPVRPTRRIEPGKSFLLSMNMQEAARHFGVPSNTIPQRRRKTTPTKAGIAEYV